MDKCPNYNFRIERKGEQACSRRRATSWITEVTLWCGAKKHSTKEHGVFVVGPPLPSPIRTRKKESVGFRRSTTQADARDRDQGHTRYPQHRPRALLLDTRATQRPSVSETTHLKLPSQPCRQRRSMSAPFAVRRSLCPWRRCTALQHLPPRTCKSFWWSATSSILLIGRAPASGMQPGGG